MFSSLFGIAAAALAMFTLGGLWYSPLLFARTWERESGITEHSPNPKAVARFSGILLGLLLVAAATLDCVLTSWAPGRGLLHGLSVGFLGGVVASAAIGMNNLFERKSLLLFLVNAGYQLTGFCLMGVLLALL